MQPHLPREYRRWPKAGDLSVGIRPEAKAWCCQLAGLVAQDSHGKGCGVGSSEAGVTLCCFSDADCRRASHTHWALTPSPGNFTFVLPLSVVFFKTGIKGTWA